jgi:hypothetical protein
VSNASFDNFKKQISDAIQFLIINKTEIQKLTRYKGVEGVELDFATARERDTFLQEYIFPAELIAIASKLGLEIRLSAYPPSDEKKNT